MLIDQYGRPFDPSLLTRDGGWRADGWQNPWTGIGTGADKTTAGRFFPSLRIMDQELRALRDGADIIAKIVEDPPNELSREGYELTGRVRKEKKSGSPTDAATDVLESDINDLREWCEEQFHIDEQVIAAMIEGRYWGGCLLILGVNDGGMPWDPIDEDRIQSLDFVSLVDRRYAYTMSQYSAMLRKQVGLYGTAEIYLISNAIASSGWNDYGSITRTKPKDLASSGGMISYLHSSRALRFDGNSADVQTRQRLAGWSWSLIQRIYAAARQFEHSFDSVSYLLSDASQGVLKMIGVMKAISAGQKQALMDRALLFDQQRSTMRSIILDAGGIDGKGAETFERAATPMVGYADILDRMMMRISAATPERYPVSLLFGRSPQGLNATGDMDMRTFYDAARAMGNKRGAPRLRSFYLLASLAKNSPMKGKKVDWAVTYKPLWSPTNKEVQDALLVRAQRDVALTDGGIVPEEVAALTWKDEYPALPVKELEDAIKSKQSFDPHEKDPDEPDPNLGQGEPLGPGAPIPTLGPSISPEAGGAKAAARPPMGAKGAPGAPTKSKKPPRPKA